MPQTITVTLPPGFSYRDYHPGQTVSLDPETVASWIVNHKVKPKVIEGEELLRALLPADIVDDPDGGFPDEEEVTRPDTEQVTFCLPAGTHWQDFQPGDEVTLDEATRKVLQARAKKRIPVILGGPSKTASSTEEKRRPGRPKNDETVSPAHEDTGGE